MTDERYEQLMQQWEAGEARLRELLRLHSAHGNTTVIEEKPWYAEFSLLENQLAKLSAEIDQRETIMVEGEIDQVPESQPQTASNDPLPSARGSGEFPWDRWEKQALADGIPSHLATLGRSVLREARMHNWPEVLQAECGGNDHGQAMLHLAKVQPDRARIRWQYLLDSDGDFHWCE